MLMVCKSDNVAFDKIAERNYSFGDFIAAWAAARRAIGTLKGEQET